MTGILAFLIGSKSGRWVALAILAAIGAWVAVKAIQRSGADRERAEQAAYRIKSLQARLRASNETINMSHDQRVDYVTGWVPGDDSDK